MSVWKSSSLQTCEASDVRALLEGTCCKALLNSGEAIGGNAAHDDVLFESGYEERRERNEKEKWRLCRLWKTIRRGRKYDALAMSCE
jgi:hypothetical protein